MNKNMKQQQQMSSSSDQRQKNNSSSNLLTADENETVFGLLGRKCQSLSTAVVQIYKTEGSAHSHWKKKHTGVVCFVKDSCIRSYFVRAYCLIKFELIWEHEVYENLRLTKARPFLLTFEGQDGHVGLNFVSEDECDAFYRVFETQMEARNRKRQERRSRPKSQTAPNIPPPTGSHTNSIQRETIGKMQQHTAVDTPVVVPQPDISRVQLRNPSKMGQVNMTLTPTPQAPQQQSSTKNFLSSSFGLSSNKDKKRKYTKADISTPMNFVHVTHVGWDADKGFDLIGNEDDEMLTNFFTKAGVSENELNDRDTRAFIYDFIQSNNVLASVKSERVEKPRAPAPAPPPVPSRHQQSHNGTTQRTAPPPPPARQPPPPVPTTAPSSSRIPQLPPSRPPPIIAVAQTVTAPSAPPPPPPQIPPAVAPPPPPPPMPVTVEIPTITTTAPAVSNQIKPAILPVINDTRSALMDSIRKGTTLKKVDTSTLSTGSGDSRSDLMSEIRLGIELRPAQTREVPAGSNRTSDSGGGTDALADALRRALQERGRVIQSSDDDDSGSSGNDDEWDD